jgi:rhamnosyltransferase subunit B
VAQSGTLPGMVAARGSLRIVVATFGSPGDLRPFLAIGGELRERGHEVVVATSAFYRDAVGAAGFAFAPVRPDREPGQQDPDFFVRLLREQRTPNAIFREMFLPSLRDSTADMIPVVRDADGVVAHTLAVSARLAAEVAARPWVSAVMQPMGFVSAHEPPVLGPAWVAALLRAAGPGPTRRVFGAARRVTEGWAAEWHQLRAELGLPRSTAHPLWEGQHAPLRALGLFPRALGSPQADWPPQARIAGFPFFVEPDEVLDPALEEFLAGGPSPVVFTLGTTAVNDPGRFYEESAEAARRLGCRAVLVVGQAQPAWSGDACIHVVPYAPHRLLFPSATAVVHQGGIGTLAEAMRAGKPMLVAPYAHDQADNAWRASRIGIAKAVPRRRYRAAVVRRVLAGVLQDERMRGAALATAKAMTRERGAARSAELIESALRA